MKKQVIVNNWLISIDKVLVQTVTDKYNDGIKVIDSRNNKDYNKNSFSKFTLNSIDLISSNSTVNNEIESNVSTSIVWVSGRQKEKLASLFLHYFFLLVSSIGIQETTLYNTCIHNTIYYILWMNWVKRYD